jgi:hypothetical protein
VWLAFPNFKTSYKAAVINMAQYWHKARQTGGPELVTHWLRLLVFKLQRQLSRERLDFSANGDKRQQCLCK